MSWAHWCSCCGCTCPCCLPFCAGPACFTHVEGTTGQDAYARHKFTYDQTCAQCGVDVTLLGVGYVAAHVMRNDCLDTCCLHGQMVLITTCKRCNNASHPNGSSFIVYYRPAPNEVPLIRDDSAQCVPPARPVVVARP
jgi:hypothetical protein